VDEHFLGQLRVPLRAGRNFSPAYPSDRERSVLVNEEALQVLGLGTPEEAVGASLTFDGGAYVVVGVVANFFTDGYHKGFRPVVLSHWPRGYRYAVARIAPGQLEPALAHLEAAWKTLNPTLTLEYIFYDDQMQASFSFVRDLMWMLGLVSGFIIFIACLGLLGMAGYTAESRVREVGIRKVLGADVRGMVMLLSRAYLKLLMVAVAVAVPLAWLLSHLFLQSHVNRIEPGPGVFLAGILPVLLLALLTVGSQALRAALTNPVETLRHE
jgi:putative ABC transport system permease protein